MLLTLNELPFIIRNDSRREISFYEWPTEANGPSAFTKKDVQFHG